jgi:hypothetical protein
MQCVIEYILKSNKNQNNKILLFSSGTPASSTTKTGRHDIAAILLKVALNHQQSKSNQLIKLVFKLSHSQLWP